MNYQKIIESLPTFSGKRIQVQPLAGGVTNVNYKITDGHNKYVARFGFESNKYLGVNRKWEVHNQIIASKLGVGSKVVGFYPKLNMLLVEYLEGKTAGRQELRKPHNIRQVARLLRKVHNGPKFQGLFDPFKVSRDYFRLVKNSWMPQGAKELLLDLDKLKSKLGAMRLNSSCHLDLVHLNILLNGNQVKFLDWEYSAKSDYRFDLAQLSASADFEPEHDKLLIKAYGRKDLNLEQLNIVKAIMLIREIGWDLVQVKYSKLNFDYKKYALGYLKRYQKIKRLVGLK